jgi:hypothetical protein
MVPRLEIWVQEGNTDVLSFSLKRPGKRIPSRFPNGAPMEMPLSRTLTYLPGSSIKKPSPKALRTEPIEREMLQS